MAQIAQQDHHHRHVTTIKEMEDKIKQIPKLLSPTAGKESCCIFKVPEFLVKHNEKAYYPQVLSIGPYHHGKPHLNMIEEHKWKFLGELLDRTPPNGLKLDGYVEIMVPLETQIRDSYSEFLDVTSSDLIKMMVLDGLFIIELISKSEKVAPRDPNDPIFNIVWILPALLVDLLLLENQIPFFVLQTLFENTRVTRSCGDDHTLAKLILSFFNHMIWRPRGVLERIGNLEGKHLLDFFGLSFIPPPTDQQKPRKKYCFELISSIPCSRKEIFLYMIPSAKILHAAGIKFKLKKRDTFLDITFRNGTLEIPQIRIDGITTWFFQNSVAFEQCYRRRSTHMTDYMIFMACLIINPSDAGFLSDQKILKNVFRADDKVAHFFNNLVKDAVYDFKDNYLSEVFEDVNEYYWSGWRVQWAGFKSTYFNTPWSFISALAALLLLILTMIQAFFAVYPFAGGKNFR